VIGSGEVHLGRLETMTRVLADFEVTVYRKRQEEMDGTKQGYVRILF
jgi:hypothetical protein